MNLRQARRERRAAERKAKKLQLKKARLAESHPIPPEPIQPSMRKSSESPSTPTHQDQESLFIKDRESFPVKSREGLTRKKTAVPRPDHIGFVSQKRADANRANAQLSTGPRSDSGKLASSRNSTKHGLSSGQLFISGEDPAAFDQLLNDLLEEHQPSSPTEGLLIKEMAQSYWLAQRALRLQASCFNESGVNEKQLALFLRYQTTHNRAFYKALATLLKSKKVGFVSQPRSQAHSLPEFVRQSAHSAGFVSQTEHHPHYPEKHERSQPVQSSPQVRNSAA